MVPLRHLLDLWLAPTPPPVAGAAGAVPRAPVSPHWRRTRASLAKHAIAVLGDVPIDQLGPAHLWTLQDYCAERGLSAETTNKVTHHLLPAMLRDLEHAGVIPEGTRARAIRGVRKLRSEAQGPAKALSLADRDRLLGAFRGHWSAPLVAFLAFTGVRIGEACGLRQRDIDWHRGTVRIARSRRGRELSAAKSRRSVRTLRVPRAALAAIAQLRDERSPEAFVFVGMHGDPIDADVFRRRTWKPRLARVGLEGVRLHDLRHTWATLTLEAGVPAAKVAAFLGDKIQTVEERYAHVASVEDWDEALRAPKLLSVVNGRRGG